MMEAVREGLFWGTAVAVGISAFSVVVFFLMIGVGVLLGMLSTIFNERKQ